MGKHQALVLVLLLDGNTWELTRSKFNSSPLKNDGCKLQDYFPIGKVTFQGLC